MSEWNPDPQLSYFGHPRLFAGYNSTDNDGDEVDGPGVNAAQWPAFVDSFISLRVMILTEDMLASFVSQCPDFTAPAEPQVYAVSAENWDLTIGSRWPDYVVAPAGGKYAIRNQPKTVTVRLR